MGLYRRYVFPRLMNRMMSTIEAKYRPRALQGARGTVLEIGFGTGLNLPHYPPGVTHITAVEPNPGMRTMAQRQIAASRIPVEYRQQDGQRLSAPDASFDSAVSTWTLCSIPDVAQALRELHRVLKPDGEFFFIEHGLSPDADVRRWQRRLTPLQRKLAAGCHLDRDIRGLIAAAGFELLEHEEWYADQVPKTMGYMYRGRARKASAPGGGAPPAR
jgi:ubiquinone/menaquinone biosynthesis C-methylase UbiE